MRKVKKLYYVKREVYAFSMKEALKTKGEVYEVQMAAENLQPVAKTNIGLKKTS